VGELPFILDHAPIIFQLDYGLKRIAYPYKFNPAHVCDESLEILLNLFGVLIRILERKVHNIDLFPILLN
jgi:hypothetical protein